MIDPVLNIIRKCNIHQEVADRITVDFAKCEVLLELDQYDHREDMYIPLCLTFCGVTSFSSSTTGILAKKKIDELVEIICRKDNSHYIAELIFSVEPDEVIWRVIIRFESIDAKRGFKQ